MNTFDADGRLAPGQNWFEQFEQKQQERFRPDDFVVAYHKTQRDIAATYSQGYRQPVQRDWGQTVSAGINIVPVVGGLKMWWEGGFSGKDMVTGQWLNRSAWETGLGVTLSFASAMPVGIMGQAANGAKFSTGYANWQTRNIAAWKTAPESFGIIDAGKLNSLPGPKLPQFHQNNFTDGRYFNRQVSGEETFYKYHGVDNRSGKTHNYVVKKRYDSETELRNDLAILEEWKIKIYRVTTFKPARGTWISEGTAAGQVGKKTGEVRSGGGYQGVIDRDNLPKSSIIRTDRAW